MFVRNVGAIEVDGRVFRAGIKGQSDIYGFVMAGGRDSPFAIPFEVECKNVKTPETPHQSTWAQFCKTWGIPRLVVRAMRGETPDVTLDRWVRETDAFLIDISRRSRAASILLPSTSDS